MEDAAPPSKGKYWALSLLVMLVTDCIWALMEDSVLKLPDLLNMAINACTVLGVAYGCFFWFRFIDDRLHPSYTSWDFGIRRFLRVESPQF